MSVSWNEPDADPIADIKALMECLSASFRPNTITMNQRVYLKIMRRTMSKRNWRRLRGRMRGENRAWCRAGRPEFA